MTSTSRMAASVGIALLFSAGAAIGAGAPKKTDVDACNQEAMAVQKGKSPSAAPGSAIPGSGPSGGQGSIQNRPMDSTVDSTIPTVSARASAVAGLRMLLPT